MSLNRYIAFLPLLFLFGFSKGQQAVLNGPADAPDREQSLQLAIQLIQKNKNDSALFYLQPLYDQLTTSGQRESPFSLKVRLAMGEALEQNNQQEKALELLNALRDEVYAAEEPEIYAGTCLVLGRLHEKIHRKIASRQNLDRAGAAIQAYQLDVLAPLYSMRMAFWHYHFGFPDSANYFTYLALNSIDNNDKPKLRASVYTLMGHLAFEKDPRLAIEHYEKASQIAKNLNDYFSLSHIWNAMTRAKMSMGSPEMAIAYNDSTISACYQAIAAGQDQIFTLNEAYITRGRLWQEFGRLDSAMHYATRGFLQQLSFLEQQQKDRIVEIDARYSDEMKSRQIAQQARVIRQERTIKYLTIGIALVILTLAFVLAFYYFRLQTANRITKEQANRLRSLNAAKSHFFANISHELRTPLTLLLGPINSLLKDGNKFSGKQTDLMQIAQRNGRKLEQLINQILDLGKLDMGKLELKQQATGLAFFFKSNLEQFKAIAQEKNIRYVYTLGINETTTAAIDREKWRQMQYNLLSNAFKYTPKGGKIEVDIQIHQENLSLKVMDNGIGIHPDDLPHLFDRYFQATQPYRSAEGGTGIGLAICREYIDLMGGEIQVESHVGKGTQFTILAPVSISNIPTTVANPASVPGGITREMRSNKASAAGRPAGDGSAPSDKPHILVVEDNLDLQEYIQLMLSDQYRITTAENGEEALKLLSISTNYQLILSDLMMPVMDGIQLLDQLRAADRTRHLPMIMLTARSDAHLKLKALRMGVDDYLIKPFEEEELRVRIENLLRNQAIRMQYIVKENPEKDTEPLVAEADRKWLEVFEHYIHDHIDQNIITIPLLAERFAMSESTLLRQIKRLTGLSTNQYLMEIRLNKARQLLENRTYRSVAEVATAVGYSEVRSFSRRFKKRFGKLPSEIQGTEH